MATAQSYRAKPMQVPKGLSLCLIAFIALAPIVWVRPMGNSLALFHVAGALMLVFAVWQEKLVFAVDQVFGRSKWIWLCCIGLVLSNSGLNAVHAYFEGIHDEAVKLVNGGKVSTLDLKISGGNFASRRGIAISGDGDTNLNPRTKGNRWIEDVR